MSDPPTPARPTSLAPPHHRRAVFRKTHRLRAAAEFAAVFQHRKTCSDSILIVYGHPNHRSEARLGLSVGKRKYRRAHERARFKRLVREAFRLARASGELPEGIDYVVVPRGGPLPRFDQVRASLTHLCRGVARRLSLSVSGPQHALSQPAPRPRTLSPPPIELDP